jgi:transposase
MLTVPPSVRVFVAMAPVDLHLSFDRLAGIVRNHLGGDPLSGHLFVFFNRSRTHLKALLFDRTGYAIYYKRLEAGTFQLPAAKPGQAQAEVDACALAMILEGIDLRAPRRTRFSRGPATEVSADP